MRGRGESVCRAWGEYAMMKAGLTPWDMPVRYYALFMQCQNAEAELNQIEERRVKR